MTYYGMITKARVLGMSCQHCVNAVFTALTAVEGITRAQVTIGAIEVEHDGRATLEQIRAAVDVASYSVVADPPLREGQAPPLREGQAQSAARRLPIAESRSVY